MKQNSLGLVSGIIEIVAGALTVAAAKFFAPVCDHMVELANGNQAHMKCYYYGQVTVLLGVLLALIGLISIATKNARTAGCIAIAASIILILLTNDSVGIGICAKSEMMCHTTALWVRIASVCGIVGGVLGLFGLSKQV